VPAAGHRHPRGPPAHGSGGPPVGGEPGAVCGGAPGHRVRHRPSAALGVPLPAPHRGPGPAGAQRGHGPPDPHPGLRGQRGGRLRRVGGGRQPGGGPGAVRHPPHGPVPGGHQRNQPHGGGGGAVRPGRHARQADEHRRGAQRGSPDGGGGPGAAASGRAAVRLLRSHGRGQQVRAGRRHRGAPHHRGQPPGWVRGRAEPGDESRGGRRRLRPAGGGSRPGPADPVLAHVRGQRPHPHPHRGSRPPGRGPGGAAHGPLASPGSLRRHRGAVGALPGPAQAGLPSGRRPAGGCGLGPAGPAATAGRGPAAGCARAGSRAGGGRGGPHRPGDRLRPHLPGGALPRCCGS
jgi:translation initiation factor IF-2